MVPYWEKPRAFSCNGPQGRVRVPLTISFHSNSETLVRFHSLCCSSAILFNDECQYCLKFAPRSEHRFEYYLSKQDATVLRGVIVAWLDGSGQTDALEAELVADKLVKSISAWIRRARRDIQFSRTLKTVERRNALSDKL